MGPRKSVLFLCTGNACRSQMAEAILSHHDNGKFIALSAGTRPAGFVHPLVLKTLEDMGISADELESKSVREFLDRRIDICITLCDSASAECPVWPPSTVQAHWALPDPTFFQGTEEKRLEFCGGIAQRIVDKISKFIILPVQSMSTKELTDRLTLLASI